MSVATVLTAASLASVAFGIFRGIARQQKMRAPRPAADDLLAWSEAATWGLADEGLGFLVVLVHWLAMAILAVGSFISIPLNPATAISVRAVLDSAFGSVLGLALVLAVALTGFLWGSVLLVPFGNPLAGDTHYAVSPDGIRFAGRLLAWASFSHFSEQSDRGLLRIWSASSPGIILLAFRPTAEEIRSTLRMLLAQYLPSAPPASAKPAYPRWLLPGAMTLASLLAATLGIWLLKTLGIYGLITNAFLIFLFVPLGGLLLMRLSFGGKVRPPREN
jgi:hypothetical protein